MHHLWLIVLPTLWLACSVPLGIGIGKAIAFGMGTTRQRRTEEDEAQVRFLAEWRARPIIPLDDWISHETRTPLDTIH